MTPAGDARFPKSAAAIAPRAAEGPKIAAAIAPE
jgi:hypothetical protein